MSSSRDDDRLYPIDEVARRLQLRPSAIRYYEDRGLIEATARHGGKRYFDANQLRRLTVIQLWKREGLLSLDSIASFLNEPDDAQSWTHAIDNQIDALTTRINQLQTARDYLAHVRAHHDTTTPDGCPHYEAQISSLGH
ncbi:MAG: MerR family transcriptional regulator [Mycobacterium sp.]|nr:MerR family transcriptional regulator [Mycobacterium sp.]